MRTAAFTTFELKVNAAGSWANVGRYPAADYDRVKTACLIHRLLSALTSFGIGAANVTVLKIMPGPTGWLEVAAYLLGGPLGILTSMAIHPWMVRRLGRKG